MDPFRAIHSDHCQVLPMDHYQVHLMDGLRETTWETLGVLERASTTDLRSGKFLVIRRETRLERRWVDLLVTLRAPFPVIHLDLCPVTPMANFPEPHPARPMVRNLVNQ